MKRILSLSICLMTALLSFAHEIEVGGMYYDITSSTEPYTVAVSYLGATPANYENEYTGDVTIPGTVVYNGKTYSVTSITNGAFSGCSGLTSVTIPESVTSIGAAAFSGCTGLTSVIIPNSVTTIGSSAFFDCSSLPSITIPNSVTSIDRYAFSGCTSLTSITIPNSVTSIGINLFYCCSGLTSVTIGNGLTDISSFAFAGCSNLSSVNIPESVTSIGSYSFMSCSSLTSVTIPKSVTSISNGAFYGCKVLANVIIPNSVTTIGEYVFKDCTGLTSITSYIQEPFSTKYCWGEVNKSIPLYVPYGTKEIYKSTDGWKEFTNIIEMEETAGINSLTSDPSAKGEESGNIYSLDGHKVSNSGLPKGIYIKNGKKVVIK